MLLILHPNPVLHRRVWERYLPPPVPLPLEKLTLVDVPILHVLRAQTLLQIVHELSLVGVACVGHHLPLPACPIIHKLTLVHVPVRKHQLPVAAHLIGNECALVDILVGPCVFALALHHALMHLALVNVPIFEVVFADAVLLGVAGLALVDPVVILDVLLGKLEGVGDDLLPEDFLGQVLQFEEDDFEGPVCYLLGGDEGELATLEKDVEFLDG